MYDIIAAYPVTFIAGVSYIMAGSLVGCEIENRRRNAGAAPVMALAIWPVQVGMFLVRRFKR